MLFFMASLAAQVLAGLGSGQDRGFNRGGTEREHKGGPPCDPS